MYGIYTLYVLNKRERNNTERREQSEAALGYLVKLIVPPLPLIQSLSLRIPLRITRRLGTPLLDAIILHAELANVPLLPA